MVWFGRNPNDILFHLLDAEMLKLEWEFLTTETEEKMCMFNFFKVYGAEFTMTQTFLWGEVDFKYCNLSLYPAHTF